MPEEALAGAGVGVRVNEPFQLGIIVPGLEIVEAGVVILVVAPVAEGVHEGDEVGGRGIGNQSAVGIPDCRDLAPGVVIVGRNDLRPGAVRVPLVKAHNVALEILLVIVDVGERGLPTVPEADSHRAAILVVLELQRPVPLYLSCTSKHHHPNTTAAVRIFLKPFRLGVSQQSAFCPQKAMLTGIIISAKQFDSQLLFSAIWQRGKSFLSVIQTKYKTRFYIHLHHHTECQANRHRERFHQRF